MATTTFKDKNTVIEAEWLNEADALVHDIFSASTTDTEARGNLGLENSSTDHGVPRFDGTAGKTQDSGVTIDDSNNVDVPGTLTVDSTSTLTGNVSVGGTVDGRDIASDGTQLDNLTVGTSTDHGIPRFNGVTGTLQDSGVTIDDSDNLSVPGTSTLTGNVSVGGTVDGRDIASDGTQLDNLTVGTSTDHGVPRFNGTTGTLQDSGVTIDDSDNITIPGDGTLNKTGSTTVFNIASDRASGVVSRVDFSGDDSGANETIYAQIRGAVETATDTSEDGQIDFQVVRGGSLSTIFDVGNGMRVGSPTGGFKGTGIINAVEVQDDGTTLTDYVFDSWYGDSSEYSDPIQKAVEEFDPKWMDIDVYSDYWKDNRRLPGMPDLNDCVDGRVKVGHGRLIHKLMQIVELQSIHIDELNRRVKELE